MIKYKINDKITCLCGQRYFCHRDYIVKYINENGAMGLTPLDGSKVIQHVPKYFVDKYIIHKEETLCSDISCR